MLYIFIAFIIISLLGIKYKKNNENFLDHDKTLMVNGFFVGLILFSHFNSYATFVSSHDLIYLNIFLKIGQLMVTTFLFYSGYGILESIKKKNNYIDNFLKNRFLKVYLSFFIAICIFIIFNLIIGENYSIRQILLSFTGWESIGNSNWFMFAVFCMYIATYISFKIFKKDYLGAIFLNLIFSFMYIFLVMKFKGYDWWYNTILCYNLGMFFSYFKENIVNYLKHSYNYILIFVLLLMFGLIIHYGGGGFFVYEFKALTFVLLVVLITYKFELNNNVLLWLGKNTFNIYILQRISYILYLKLGVLEYNIYVYFGLSVISTILIVLIFDKMLKFVYAKLKI